jgi:heptosyltransferase-2
LAGFRPPGILRQRGIVRDCAPSHFVQNAHFFVPAVKIAIFLPNWLGDLVMATPAIRAVRAEFGPEASVAGILRPNLAGLLAGTGWLDEEWHFDPHAGQADLGHGALLRRLRQARLDLVLMLTNSLRPAVLSWMAGVPRRVGYARSGRGLFLSEKPPVERRGRQIVPAPMVDYYLKLAEAAGCRNLSRRLELALTDDDREAAVGVWSNLGLRDDGRMIALNSSGAYGAAKLWPPEHFAELARRVVDQLDHDVLVICGPAEREIAREIVRLAGRDRVFSLADQRLGLATSKGCFARCRLAVSTDSGPRHMAAALGKPVVTLLGPTLPVWIANPAVTGVDVQADVDCLGCGRRVCPLGHHRCMKELAPDTVYRQVARLLEETYSERAA